MKYRSNFGEMPRYHNSLGDINTAFKDVEKDFINAISVDYDPETGKITPKIDLTELQKQLTKSLVDKLKQEIKSRVQAEAIKQMSSQVAAMYSKFVVPGLQIVGAIQFAIKAKKTIAQILDLAFVIYGKKILDHVNRLFFGSIGQYRDRYVTFENAANNLFYPSSPRVDDTIPGYKDEYNKFQSMKFRATPQLIMLQYYPYYSGEKLEMNIINELYPDFISLDKTARYMAAKELSLLMRNSIEEPITTYLYSEEKKLKDGKIEISVSSEFQEELDKTIPLYLGEDSDFFYEIKFYTDSDKNLQSEFTNKNYIIVYDKEAPDKHKVRFDFISLFNAPDEIKPFVLKMNDESLRLYENIKIIKKEKDIFVELPIEQYTKIYSHPNAYGRRIILDYEKIPKDVYIISNKKIGTRAGQRDSDLWVNYLRDAWPYKEAKDREEAIISNASFNLLQKAVDLTAVDPIEEYNLFVTQENTVKNEPPGNEITYVNHNNPVASSTVSKFGDSFNLKIKLKENDGYIANALKTMDSSTSKIFMLAMQTHPYPFKGLSHAFYFNRVNKIVNSELEVMRKRNQKLGLGVAGIALLSYLATKD